MKYQTLTVEKGGCNLEIRPVLRNSLTAPVLRSGPTAEGGEDGRMDANGERGRAANCAGDGGAEGFEPAEAGITYMNTRARAG